MLYCFVRGSLIRSVSSVVSVVAVSVSTVAVSVSIVTGSVSVTAVTVVRSAVMMVAIVTAGAGDADEATGSGTGSDVLGDVVDVKLTFVVTIR